jgi:para-nitrobenzyl esterase
MRKLSLIVAMVIVMLFATIEIALAGKLGTTVETQYGLVLGTEETEEGYQTWSWKGIPFARPPERWEAPRPPKDWGALTADTFGSHCPQYVGTSTGYVVSGSEDCLYLNVWRPRTQERNLPVYFWIHGGGNSTGTGSDPMFHGNKLAPRANMVVVTVNYRLGPLGWFVLPETLQDGNPWDESGNYGTLDIIHALSWVRENIAAFGGNPHNITIAGQSSGGYNVCTLLISPRAKGLFHRAISESGGFVRDTNSMEVGRASAQAAIEKILENDGFTDPNSYPKDLKAYLMSKTPEEIFAVYPVSIRGMLYLDSTAFVDRFTDGKVISALGKEALKNPKTYNQVPTILGTNKEESKFFMALTGVYGKISDSAYQATAMATTVPWQQEGVNHVATAMSANEGQPDVFAYRFNYGAYNVGGYNAWPTSLPGVPYNFAIMMGAAHGLEIPFIFGEWTYGGLEYFIFRPDNAGGREALSDAMVKYWASFARTGIPTDPMGVVWEPWSNEEGGAKRIMFDANDTQSIIEMNNQ